MSSVKEARCVTPSEFAKMSPEERGEKGLKIRLDLSLSKPPRRRIVGCTIGPAGLGFRPIFSGDHDPDDD